jgi:3'-phosphoadenosine 5'-phosphosulfate sulfotransferase (PAPS reductase)/FAD synthetase
MSPYRIEGPALISFSGGRTSGFMLHEIVRAFDGKLPDDVHVCFANTGKEREETLTFVQRCSEAFGVHVHWLERRERYGPLADRFTEVSHNSASRQGEPFATVIQARGYTPNAVTRFCTDELKVKVMGFFAQETLGWDHWTSIIGLRADEGHRVLKALASNDAGKRRDRMAMPLMKAGVTKADVMAFWGAQPFDLGLRGYEGNCDLCFLKSRGKLSTIIREQPGTADWWIEQEKVGKGRFVTEYSYATLQREVTQQPSLFDPAPDDDEHDVECGLMCSAEAA